MEEFVNEIINSLQDNPEMAVTLGGAVASIGALKGREVTSNVLDEVSKAVYDPVSYSTNDLKKVEGPIKEYLADRRIKMDEEGLCSSDYQLSDD